MTDPVAAPRPHARSIGWYSVAVAVVAILGIPAFLDQGVSLRRAFDERPLRVLEETQPRGVFIGDSMLGSRIDPSVLKTLTPERWVVLAQPGGSSAVWYLMMKNLIAVQSPPPRTVVIFFRDRQLTLPAHRTDVGYRKTIEAYMRGDERKVETLLRTTSGRRQSALERLSMTLYPVQWRRDDWQENVQRWALDFIASSRSYGKIRDDAREIFDVQNLRQDSGQDYEREEGSSESLDPEDHDFAAMLEASFLPEILEIARERGIQLIFFRVKRQRLEADGSVKQSVTYPAYKEALQACLEKADAKLIDETPDPDVTPNFYGTDDHVAPAMKKAYTQMFWRKMGPRLEPAVGNPAAPVR